MKYAKPELTLLARSIEAIQGLGKMPHTPPDNQPNSVRLTVSAYEADE